jgi:hypothetical protein
MCLASIRRRFEEHLSHVRRTLHQVLETAEEGQLLLFSGRAIEAICPEFAAFPRVYHDVDVFAPDLRTGLLVLGRLWERHGFALRNARLARVDGRWVGHWVLSRTSTEGHLLLIDLIVGGRPPGPGGPPWVYTPLWERARLAEWDGRRVRVPSPEDLILMLADKTHRVSRSAVRYANDVRYFLAREGPLDWDYLCRTALDQRVGAALHVLLSKAETREGRTRVPPDVLDRLVPHFLERCFIPSIPARMRSPYLQGLAWRLFWYWQYLAARSFRPALFGRLVLQVLRLGHPWDSALRDLSQAGEAEKGAFDMLVLQNTGITDAGLAHLGRFPRLHSLALGHTKVSDAGLAHLRHLTGLRRLDLSKTKVTEAGLAHLEGLSQLQELNLDGTRTHGRRSDPLDSPTCVSAAEQSLGR